MTILGCQMKRGVSELLSLLVGILTLSNQDAYHIKVAITSSAPDNVEAELGFRVLAHIEGKSVLTVSHIAKLWITIN